MSRGEKYDAYALATAYLRDWAYLFSSEECKTILGYIRSRALQKIIEWASDFPHEQTVERAMVKSQLSAFFKKNADYRDSSLCEVNTRKNFERAERLCRITNRRLDHYGLNEDRIPPDLRAQIAIVRSELATCLGDARRFRDWIPEYVKVTSGATSDRTREKSVPYMKVRSTVRATKGAWPYVKALSRFHTGKEPRRMMAVAGNTVIVVPKQFDVDRTIAKEPLGNLPFQLAVDTYGKMCLKRHFNVNLSTQRRNQEMALTGSLDGHLATVDLSMASDTLAYNVIPYLFPEDWWRLLHSLRSHKYSGVFGDGTYAKFSSMGNGYTFTLETMLFSACCVAVGAREWSVYGDDIVLETSLVASLLRLLRFLGFVPNVSKTFSHGPFRESCGEDYYAGRNIRPVFYRKTPTNKMELSHLVNEMVRIGLPYGHLWELLRGIVKTRRILLVPVNESTSSGIHIDIWHARRARDHKGRRVLRTSCHIPQFRGYVAIYDMYCGPQTAAMYSGSVVKGARKGVPGHAWGPGGVRGDLLWFFRRFADDASMIRKLGFIRGVSLPPFVRSIIVERQRSQDVGELSLSSLQGEVSSVPLQSFKVAESSLTWFPCQRGAHATLFAWSDFVTGRTKTPRE